MIAAATSVTASGTSTAGRRSATSGRVGAAAALAKWPPPPPVAPGQLAGGLRAVAAGLVRRGVGRVLEQRLDRRPLRLDLGAGGEQRRVSRDRVAEQALVGLRGVALRGFAGVEVELDLGELEPRSRPLAGEVQLDPLSGLD